MTLALEHISMHYTLQDGTRITALKDISLELPNASFNMLVGKSGCGKTTLLRILAGLEKPDAGHISHTGPSIRNGIMFQTPRLLPWLTVWDNICLWKYGHGGSQKLARHYLQVFGLEHFRDAYPHQLSGGMAQRAALARTLSYEPTFLLLDEPFAALDYFTRQQLQDELMQQFADHPLTIFFITHDVAEAARLGQRIIIMENGRINGLLTNPSPYPRPVLNDRFALEKQIISLLQNK